MKLTSHTAQGLAAAAIIGTAILLPAAVLASAGPAAATTGSPVWARRAHPVTVYVASYESSTVTPIRAAANKAGKAITVGGLPRYMAITPNGKTAYVSSGSTVTAIRTATNTTLKAISVGNAGDIAITPNGKTAYVVNGSTVTPINTATNKAGKAIAAR